MRANAPRGRPGDKMRRDAVSKEADARAAAAENVLNASLGMGGKRLDAEANRQSAAAQAESARIQEAGATRRAREQQQSQLANTDLTQQRQLEREVLQQNLGDQREARKSSREDVQETQKALLDRFTQKDKSIPVMGSQGDFLAFNTQAGEKLKARGFSPEQVQRFADGDFKNRAELNLMLGYYDMYLRNEDPWIGSKPTPGETIDMIHPRN